jgi:hypothetical protein
VSSFADTAEAYWYDPANKNKPLQDYAEHLITKVNGMLKALGSVECRHSCDTSGGDSGSFSRTTWNIEINPNKCRRLVLRPACRRGTTCSTSSASAPSCRPRPRGS